MHHIVFDGWSMGMLLARAVGALRRFAAGRRRPCRSCRAVRRLCRLAARWLQGEVLEGAAAPTGGSGSTALPRWTCPTDRPRPAVETYRGAGAVLRLPARLTRCAQTLSRREEAPRCSWRCWPRSGRCCTATATRRTSWWRADRQPHAAEIEGADRLLCQHAGAADGPVGRPEFRELLRRVREVDPGGLRPPGPAVREAGGGACTPARNLSRTPLFQVLLRCRTPGRGPRSCRACTAVARVWKPAAPSSTSTLSHGGRGRG